MSTCLNYAAGAYSTGTRLTLTSTCGLFRRDLLHWHWGQFVCFVRCWDLLYGDWADPGKHVCCVWQVLDAIA